MRGYLVKEPVHGHALSRSRRRLFVLRDRELVWSVDETSAPKGTIRLDGARVEREGNALVVTETPLSKSFLPGNPVHPH